MNESRTANAPAVNQTFTSRIPVRSISLAIVVTVVLYTGMVTFADWKAFNTAVSALPGLLWGQVAALSLLSYILRFARWHRFIVGQGHKVPILRSLEIYLAAFALTLTPGKAGETIRSVYLHPYGVTYPQSVGAFVSERLMDLLAVGGLASLAILLFPEQKVWILAAIAGIVAIFLLFRSRMFNLIGLQFADGSVIAQAANLNATVRFLLSGSHLAVAAPLSLVAWLAQGISLFLIVHALGYELTHGTVISIYCLSILGGAASFIPGGLGATEAAIVLLLSLAGVERSDAITASILSRGLTLWLAVGVGVLFMMKLTYSAKG